jgi:hypothetical protein
MAKHLFPFLIILWANANELIAQTPIQSIHPSKAPTLFLSIDSQYFHHIDCQKNCEWVFNNIPAIDSTYLYYIDPSQTPYHTYFQGATVAMTTDYQMFSYFKFDSSGYYELGQMGYDTYKSNGEYSKYKSAAIVLQYPLQYGDSFQSKDYKTQDFCKYTFSNIINTNKKIDAYGTLILNKDTFKQTLRIKEETKRIDSVFTYGKNKNFIIKKAIESYQWYSKTINAPLLTLQKNTYILNGDTVVYMHNSMYSKGLPQADAFYQFSPILSYNENSNAYEITIKATKNNDTVNIALFQQNYPTAFRNYNFTTTATKTSTFSIAKEDIFNSTPIGQIVEFRIKSKHTDKSLYLLIN